MNQTRFQKWMNAVDDDLLEEAQQPIKKKRSWLYSAGAIAACLAVAVTAVTMTRRGTDQTTMMANPMHESSAAEFQQLGYSIPLPDSASDTSYYLVDTGESDKQMAEVNFEQGGQAYYCRALKAEQPQDISGIFADWTESLDWSGEDVSVQLRKSENAAWVGWYAPEAEVQWCVAGGSDAQVLLDTAQTIVEKLGYVMPLYPMDSAEDACYLNVVINPGKENSEEQAFQVDKSTEVEFDAMEGYQMYYDYDCTQPMDWIDVGQNKLTVYITVDPAK